MDQLLDFRRQLWITLVEMLTEDDLIFAQILLRCVSFHLLHGHLILEEFFRCRLESLLLDRAGDVALLEDAAGDEHIVVYFMFIGS